MNTPISELEFTEEEGRRILKSLEPITAPSRKPLVLDLESLFDEDEFSEALKDLYSNHLSGDSK